MNDFLGKAKSSSIFLGMPDRTGIFFGVVSKSQYFFGFGGRSWGLANVATKIESIPLGAVQTKTSCALNLLWYFIAALQGASIY